jgi:hypothetical protein
MERRRGPPSQTWKTFLKNHMAETAAIDFFVVPTVTFQLLYGFVVLRHERREVVHFAVTTNPSATWTARQLTEAFPWDEAPRYLLRDRDLWRRVHEGSQGHARRAQRPHCSSSSSLTRFGGLPTGRIAWFATDS